MSDERPLPSPDPGTAAYWDSARAHQLRVPKCQACGKVHFYPRTRCPHCSSATLEWIEASGHGTVYSYTVVHRAPSAAFKTKLPYVVAIVALEEGPHLMTNLAGCPVDAVHIGMAVRVAWEDIGPDATLPVFVPATG